MPPDHPTLQTLQQTPTTVQIVILAIYGITELYLDRRIQPVHQASWLVTANRHMKAIKADMRFSFTNQHAPKYYTSSVTNYSCGISFCNDDGQILKRKSQRPQLSLSSPNYKN